MLKTFRERSGISDDTSKANTEYQSFLQFFEYAYSSCNEIQMNAEVLA